MDLYYFTVFACFAFGMGACIASFLNVCIWRIPRGESVVSPPSHCPRCNAPIRWHQNIPILSWCCLRGRCANCREPISIRYTIVELMGGILFLLAYTQWGMPFFLHSEPVLGLVACRTLWTVPACWIAFAGLMLGSFIDLEHFYLPDRVTIGGMILGVPLSYFVPELQGEFKSINALYMSLMGMVGGFLFLWLVGWVFTKILKKDALGFGDVKLIGAVGAFFGPWAVLFTIVASSFVGAVVGIVMIVKGKARLGGFTAVPFGPFLAVGAVAWVFWGPKILAWYLSLGMGRGGV
jgi:leader peptidase (prepilin peptidase)/N-methyltransferase